MTLIWEHLEPHALQAESSTQRVVFVSFLHPEQSGEDLLPAAGLAPHPAPAPWAARQNLQKWHFGLKLPLSFAGICRVSQVACSWSCCLFALGRGLKGSALSCPPPKRGGQAPPHELCFPLRKASYAGQANAFSGCWL